MAEDRNLNIEMDPEVYKVFMESTSISSKFVIVFLISIFYSCQGHQWILNEEECSSKEKQGPDHGGQDARGVQTERYREETAVVESDGDGAGRGAIKNLGNRSCTRARARYVQ